MIIGDKGKPPSFDGVKKLDFADWNFKLKAFIGNLNQKALKAMCLIEHSQDTLKPENYTDGEQQLASSLYFQLTMYTEGTPLGIIRKVTNQDGFEAYRKLCYQYDPQTMGNTLARLMKILEFNFGADGDFLDKLASFEGMIEEYEKSAGEALSDNIRSAIMVAKSPEALRNHILLTVPKEQVKWPLVKKVAMDYFLACQSMSSGPQAMDVGAVWSDKGKGKDKGKYGGKKGKGKGKDSEKGGKNGKKDERFQGHCGKCGKWGHKQQDCFARVHNVESWQEGGDAAWPDAWQPSPEPQRPVAGYWSWADGGESPGSTMEDPAALKTNAIICKAPYASSEHAWIFAVGTSSNGHWGSTGPGQALDLLVDTGANRSVCGPSHFPSFPLEEGQRKTISVADGSEMQYYGDKRVRLKVGDDTLEVKFHVTDVTQPILAVSSMNEAGATVEFPCVGSNRTASIMRDSATGRRRLELKKMYGSFVLRATVARAASGRADPTVHATPTTDAPHPTAQQVDETTAPESRPEATTTPAPRELTRAELEMHEAPHCPYAAGCTDRVLGRGTEGRGEAIEETIGNHAGQIDYVFGKPNQAGKAHPVGDAIDSAWHQTSSVRCDSKGGATQTSWSTSSATWSSLVTAGAPPRATPRTRRRTSRRELHARSRTGSMADSPRTGPITRPPSRGSATGPTTRRWSRWARRWHGRSPNPSRRSSRPHGATGSTAVDRPRTTATWPTRRRASPSPRPPGGPTRASRDTTSSLYMP
jgi:hypothetical protein